ncbi:ABC transporter ATP-binding protein [Salinispira pacifica]|uniref:Multidrug resistance-like ATP-binding protein MdlB n=1 Tax=Salinispira pacifica TaxID=1307761 RepID=V5WGS8_9SPIO|nr:ABC transporter ATP-binding protein [Salinispira pacifica]AHC14769.1 hypothetical protein L21SP2_1370 [Salinispira pacifica]
MISHEEMEFTGFQKGLVLRLFQYMRRYSWQTYLSMFFIVLTTLGQLSMPVIIQRAVDNNLQPGWLPGEASDLEGIREVDPRIDDNWVELNGLRFYSQRYAGRYFRGKDTNPPAYYLISRTQEAAAPRSLSVPSPDPSSPGAPVPADSLLQKIERSLPDAPNTEYPRLLYNDQYAAIQDSAYRELDRELKRELRAADWRGIRNKALLYLGILILVLISSFLQIFFMALAGQNVMKDLRVQLYHQTIHQDLRFLQNQQVGKLVTRVSSDVETINELFTNVLTSIISDVIMMAGVMITLFLLDVQLGLISLAILPPVALLLLFFRHKARSAYRKVRKWVSSVNAYISEHLGGVSLVQVFARETETIREFTRRNYQLFKANLSELYVFTVFRPVVDFLSTMSIALVLFAGAHQLLSGLVSLGVLIAFINLIQRFYQPVRDMAEKFTLIQSAMAGSERVFSLLDEKHLEQQTIEENDGSFQVPEKEQVKGSIEFRDVHFSYNPGEPVLQGISFSGSPGQRIALVGYTGSGKTTIANVLSRLWEIQKGTIYIDGMDVKQIPLHRLRTIVQPVQQDVTLFHMSLRENLLLGKKLPDERVFEVLDTVQAGDFIRRLPKGLDTMVSESGENFSSGQLQLLSFARLLLQDPKIIIMDEATANIDTETERKIQHAMETLMTGRTSIVIAHRLSTIMDADNIVVLHQGKVAESGTHEQLMKKNGLYFNLQQLQFKRDGTPAS